MKTTVVIAEYNPMTNGHVAHLQRARAETNADCVIVVMSGSFTQRGEAAVADKYIRASIAIRNGADLVVELPTVFAISPADNFALGAMKTLSVLPGNITLSFGSECGDIDALVRLADLLSAEPPELKAALKESLAGGNCYPRARADALRAWCALHPEDAPLAPLLDAPNNVLGVAYIQAARNARLPIAFHTVRRVGQDHTDAAYDDDGERYPSSSAVRAAFYAGEPEKVRAGVPKETYELMTHFHPNPSSLGDLALFRIKSISGYELEHFYDVTGGIHNRLKIAAASATTYEQMLEGAKTKAYTMARLKRITLYALFDITAQFYADALAAPPYVQILAIRESRRDLLSKLSQCTRNVLTRYSDVGKVDKALRPFIKLDFTAQGTLEIINRSNYFNKKALIIGDDTPL